MTSADTQTKPNRCDLWAVVALAAFITLLLGRELLAPTWMAPGLPGEDGQTQWLPWRDFGFGWMSRGVLPLWNPHILCGTPFAGAWQSALFYPPNQIFLILPPGVAARLIVWLHLMLSAGFTYALARSMRAGRPGAVIAALGFTLGAPQILRVYAGHWGATCAIPWLPLILLSVDRLLVSQRRAWFLVGAAAAAMQLLAGAPQYAVFSAVAVGAYAVFFALLDHSTPWTRRLLALALCLGLYVFAAALAAVQVLPGLETARYGARSVGMRPEWSLAFSWGPEGFITLLLPGFFGGPTAAYWGRYNLWEMTAYCGAAVAALACAGMTARRRPLALAAAAVVTAALALGEHAGVFGLLTGLGGPFAAIRGPAKFLCPFSLFVALLAGLGLSRLCMSSRRRVAITSAIVAAAAVAVLVFALAVVRVPAPWRSVSGALRGCVAPQRLAHESAKRDGEPGDVLRTASALALLACGLALAAARRKRLGAWIIAFAAAVELGVYAWPCLGRGAMFDVREAGWDRDVAAWIRGRAGAGRTCLRRSRFVNHAMRLGLDTHEGVEPNPPRWYHELFRAANRLPRDVAPSIYQSPRPAPMAAWTATQSIVTPGRAGLSGRAAFAGRRQTAYPWTRGLPRCFIVYRARPTDDRDALAAATRADWRRAVVVPKGSPAPPPDPHPQPSPLPTYRRLDPNTVRITADLRSPGWLVVLDSFAPGWRAFDNGKPVPLVRANHAFMAVPLPAGRRSVTLVYRPPSLAAGLWVSGVSLGALILAASGVALPRRRLPSQRDASHVEQTPGPQEAV